MVIDIKKLLNELLEKEAEKRNLELKVLQEQITPHFIYNTLFAGEDCS
jgi:two-component system sensor histidine kinase YesM